MSSSLLESKRHRRPKKIRYAPFNVVALTVERQVLEEKRIREAYDREVKELNREKK